MSGANKIRIKRERKMVRKGSGVRRRRDIHQEVAIADS